MVAAPVEARAGVALADGGRHVDVRLGPAGVFRFHAMWLRDACRDPMHVDARGSGERLLTATPVGPAGFVDPSALAAVDARWERATDGGDCDELVVVWNDASAVRESRLPFALLREFAPVAAMAVEPRAAAAASPSAAWHEWLEPFTGFPDARAQRADEWRPFYGDAAADGGDAWPPRFEHADVMRDDAAHLALLRALLRDGAVLVENVPPEGDSRDAARELHAAVGRLLGGLQKDPTRAEANWKIVKKADASSISYDPAKRLYQHTDSSIPPHGVPGLALSMHYVAGFGANTLTDGFAVARDLKARDARAFELLATYGYDGERDFAASRKDSTQSHAAGLVVRRKHPVFALDARGELSRVQYNEVFRTPLSLPFDVFREWYQAFSTFVGMLHSDEYQRTVEMTEGTILLMNNWRTLHGRAGGRASPDRHLVGGTITRENVYSVAMQLSRALADGPAP